MKIRISEEDADRLDCPAVLDFDETKLMGREIIRMQKQTGWSMDAFGHAMRGVAATDRDGNPRYATDDDGAPVLDDTGQPVPLREVHAEVLMVMVWLAAGRAGCAVTWDDFDVNLAACQFEPADPAGKAPASARKTTKTSTRGTRRR